MKKIAGVLAVLTLFFAAPAAEVQALEGDNKAVLITDVKSENCIRVFLSSMNTIEATVRIDCSLQENVTATHALPYDFVVEKNYRNYELMRFLQRQSGVWRCQYKYFYKLGVPSNKQTVDYLYSLPYSKKEHFTVSQSYFGKFSHYKGSQAEYAVDFRMPVGTRILAAREGTVVAFRQDSRVGGPGKEFVEKENFVVIKHDDGTYANYLHLQANGVLVKLGEKVRQGDPIALSGATGMATEPHLHFCVYRVKNAAEMVSLPFRVKSANGISRQLQPGEVY